MKKAGTLWALLMPLMAAFWLATMALPATAALISVDMLTDSQFALTTTVGPTVSNTLQQGLGELPNAASFVGSRTISAQMTGGSTPVAVLASVGGGNFTCDRSVGTLGICDLIYTLDETLSISRVLLGVSTDLTGVGNATLALYIDGAVAPVWSHVMSTLTESFDISFGMTTFNPGTTFDLRSTGAAAVDFSAYEFQVDQQVSEPGTLAAMGIGAIGLAGFMRRREKRASSNHFGTLATA